MGASTVEWTCLGPSAAAAREPAVSVTYFVFPSCGCALGWLEVAVKAVDDVPGRRGVCKIACLEVVDGQFDLGLVEFVMGGCGRQGGHTSWRSAARFFMSIFASSSLTLS